MYAAPDKLAAFHDQTRKVLLLYGRMSEQAGVSELVIHTHVKTTFELVMDAVRRRGGDVGMEGDKWTALCEVVLHIAKRVRLSANPHLRVMTALTRLLAVRQANDLVAVEKMSLLLGASAPLTDSKTSPETQATQMCAKLVNSMTVLEYYFKSKEGKLYSTPRWWVCSPPAHFHSELPLR